MEKVLLKFLTEYSFVATLPDQEEEDGDEDEHGFMMVLLTKHD